MLQAYFSLADEEYTLQERVLLELDEVEILAEGHTICLSIMVFSFTDIKIYNRLIKLLRSFPNTKIRVLADFSNISDDMGKKIPALAAHDLPNLEVRLKYDFPYSWNPDLKSFEWNYKSSLGFLHHKTMCVEVDGITQTLLAGSYNWTKKSNNSYEHIIKVGRNEENDSLLASFKAEFEALWSTPCSSVTYFEAEQIFKLTTEYRLQGLEIDPISVLELKDAAEIVQEDLRYKPPKLLVQEDNFVAFNANHATTGLRNRGFAIANHLRRFMMMKHNGKPKKVPLDIQTVTLDFIFRCNENSCLKIAMFALSNRVPEFNAILNAARRGVKVMLILDKKSGRKIKALLMDKIIKEQLSFMFKTSNRMMHHKYMVNTENNSVITGTANMTTDAYDRHSEHRMVFNNNPELAKRFDDNFNLMWDRLEELV